MAERIGQYLHRLPGELLRSAAGLSGQPGDLRQDFLIPEARQFGRDIAGMDPPYRPIDIPVSSPDVFPDPLSTSVPMVPSAREAAAAIVNRAAGQANTGGTGGDIVDSPVPPPAAPPRRLARSIEEPEFAGIRQRSINQSIPDIDLNHEPTRLALSAAQMEQDFGANELMNARHEQAMARIKRDEERNDPMTRQLEAAAKNAAYESMLPYGSTSRLQAAAGGKEYDIPGVTGERQLGGMTNEQGARLRQQAALAPENIKAGQEEGRLARSQAIMAEFDEGVKLMEEDLRAGKISQQEFNEKVEEQKMRVAMHLQILSGGRDFISALKEKPSANDWNAGTVTPAR